MTEQEKNWGKMRQKAAKLNNPSPVELPSHSWRCQVMHQGRRISVTDADPAVAHAKVLAIKNGFIQENKGPLSLTVGEAIDRYIDSKDSVLSPATIRGYKRMRKNDLQELMPIRLPALTQETIQRAINKMARNSSPKSVRNAHGLLSAALAAYYPDFVLRTTLPQKQRYEASIPDVDQIRTILALCANTKMELPILLATWLGLRQSEIRALTWDCIDGDVLHVKGAIVDGDWGPVSKGTKTYSGDRYIRIPERIKAVLSSTPKANEHIINLSGQAMYKRFTRLLDKAGLPHYRFHDLRHVAASVAMSVGVPNLYNQQRLGHKTDHMLKTVYLHTLRSKEDAYATLIDQTFEEILHTDLHTHSNDA